MEHVIYQSIMQHLEDKNILNSNQHGNTEESFLWNPTCVYYQRPCERSAQWLRNWPSNVWFRKAFDKVPHQILLSKLYHYGIQGKTLTWINSWLTERFQRVVMDGEASGLAKVTSDVPQGTVLGPLMFLLFINDIHENINSSLRLFADYALLYRSIDTTNNCAIRQNGINKLVS